VLLEFEKKLGDKRDAAIFVALALSNSDHHAAAVDVFGDKVQPLRETQSGRVESEQERPVLGAEDGVEEGADFPGTQNDWKSPLLLRERQILSTPLPIERDLVEEPQSREALDDRAASETLAHEVELVGADLFRPQLRGAPLEVLREPPDPVDIGLDCPRRKVANP
jgi:hypothetical protein